MKRLYIGVVFLLAHINSLLTSSVHAQSAGNKIKFGMLHLFTGDFAYLGERCRNGMELAKEDVNKEGGIHGQTLEIVYEDWGQINLVKAVSAAQKLISIDKVSALFPAWAEDTKVVAPIAERAKIPLMTSGAGGVNIGQFGPHVFRASNSDEAMLEAFASYLEKQAKKRACVVRGETAYYESIAAAFPSIAKAHGIELISFHTTLELGESKTIATKIKHSHCDAVISLATEAAFVPFLRDLRNAGYRDLVMGPVYMDTGAIQIESEQIIGDFVLAQYRLPAGEFAERYQQRFGTAPLRPVGNCYDAVKVISHVMNTAGTSFESVNKGLLNLKDYVGVTGPFMVSKNGDRHGEYTDLVKITSKALIPLDYKKSG